MIKIDLMLIELNNFGIDHLSKAIPDRDKKILSSLAKQINAGHFLTENQGNLLVKILKENKDHLTSTVGEKILAIESPTWSQGFRKIEQIRKIYLTKEAEPRILVEFTYNKRLKQLISDMSRHVHGQIISLGTKSYSLPFNEKNIYLVMTNFKNFKFDIDQKISEFYTEILEIHKNYKDPVDILSTTNLKLKDAVIRDIQDISEENLIKLNDRRLRFQYHIFPKNSEISLKNSIANRPSTRVWIDSTKTSLIEIVSALKELDRLPLLVVFNGHDSKECFENLKKVQKSLIDNAINDKIGIYFRFGNSLDSNKKFNQLISDAKYNSPLDMSTLVAGISNNKLPKFMIKNNWYPKSVITFTNNFKNHKSGVFCDAVDLQIYYNDKQPMLGGIDALV